MKKIIAFLLVFTLSFGAVTNISALNNSASYIHTLIKTMKPQFLTLPMNIISVLK